MQAGLAGLGAAGPAHLPGRLPSLFPGRASPGGRSPSRFARPEKSLSRFHAMPGVLSLRAAFRRQPSARVRASVRHFPLPAQLKEILSFRTLRCIFIQSYFALFALALKELWELELIGF